MAKFGSIATVAESSYPTLELGQYRCSLEIETGTRKRWKSEEEEPAIKFIFTTLDATWEGQDKKMRPFRLTKTTGTNYGPERAAITQLMYQFYGRHLSGEEFTNLDTEELTKDRVWIVKVDEETDEQGRLFNRIIGVKAEESAKKRKTRVVVEENDDDEELDDPFAK